MPGPDLSFTEEETMVPELFMPLVVAPLAMILGIGGVILLGQRMRYRYLERARGGDASSSEMVRLLERVDSLREDVQSLQDRFDRLGERVDFTERLLSEPRPGQPPSVDREST